MINRKKIGWALLAVLIVIQFFRPDRNLGNNIENDISKTYLLPDSVTVILKTSCYDCHSNYTVYPWYTNIQPVGWWLTHHINEGKSGLNFSEFSSYPPYKKYHRMDQLIKLVNKGEMPLHSYTLIHRYAILDTAQRNTLTAWAKTMQQTLKASYPADSLVNPRDRKGRP